VGKSILVRLSDLRDLGGWRALQNVLAEDYEIGQLFARAGYRVVISSQTLPVIGGSRSVRAFAARHLRWSQMRRRISLSAYVGELLLNPAPVWVVVALLSVARAIPSFWLGVAAAGLLAKAGLEAVMVRRMRGSYPMARALLLIPFKDLIIFAVWSLGMFRRRVVWRGRAFLLAAGSRLEPIREVPAPKRTAVREAA
jgi:ceramide glucosyltransferase